MNTRIETFRNLGSNVGDRAFVALSEAIGNDDDGKRRVTACITFFGRTEEEAFGRANSFVNAQLKKEADLIEARRVRAEKRRA